MMHHCVGYFGQMGHLHQMGPLGLELRVLVPEVAVGLELFSAWVAVAEAPRATKQTIQYQTDRWTKDNDTTQHSLQAQ